MTHHRIDVAVTGVAWMGSGVGSIESALSDLFRKATEEVALTAYAIGEGADPIFDGVEGALARGIRVTMIVNRLSTQPPVIRRRLDHLAQAYPHLRLYDFSPQEDTDLHAKVVVADRRIAIVGSSNLSRRGLVANHELALFIEGPKVEEIARALDVLSAQKEAIQVTTRMPAGDLTSDPHGTESEEPHDNRID